MLTVAPLTAQLPLAPKVTARPDDAVALTVKLGSPYVFPASAPNAIVWLAFEMLNVCGTFAAALKLAFPGCEAVTVQMPAPVMVTVFPDIVQLPPAPKLTARPEDAVAPTAKLGSPYVF